MTVAAACSPVETALRAGPTAGAALAQERSPEEAARHEIVDAAIARRVRGARETIDELRTGELSLPDNARDRRIDARTGLQPLADAGVSAFDYHVSVVGGAEGARGAVMHTIAGDDALRSAAR